MNHSKLRYVVGALFILILVVAFYFIDFLGIRKPYEVLTPEVYDPGTTVSLYEQPPTSLPMEFILEDFKVDYVGEVKGTDNTVQTTVSFLSTMPILDIVNTYRLRLGNKGWDVKIESLQEDVAVLGVYDDEEIILVTASKLEENSSMITIQY